MLLVIGLIATAFAYPAWPLIPDHAQIQRLLALITPKAKALEQRIQVALRTETFKDTEFAKTFVRLRETWYRNNGEAREYKRLIADLNDLLVTGDRAQQIAKKYNLQGNVSPDALRAIAARYRIQNLGERIQQQYLRDLTILSQNADNPQIISQIKERWAIGHDQALEVALLSQKVRMLNMLQ
jgi:hypothetical protein